MPDPVIVPGAVEKFRASVAFQKLKTKIPTIDAILQETGAVIAGGGVLGAIAPTPFVSSDFDIYVSCRNLPRLLEAVRSHNFKEFSKFKASEYCKSFLRRNGIRTVQRFGETDVLYQSSLALDIMAVRHKRTPLQVVQNFDLTACQTWYDGQNVYATHPEHIATMRATLQGDYVRVLLHGNTFLRNRINKYNQRGFTIQIEGGLSLPPPGQDWEEELETHNRECYKSDKIQLEPGSKGTNWARKYLFRVAIGTARANIFKKIANIYTDDPAWKAEEGYDSEDYVENPQKILELVNANELRTQGTEFLELIEKNPEDRTVPPYENIDELDVVPQAYNENWSTDYVEPYRRELEALVGTAGPQELPTKNIPSDALNAVYYTPFEEGQNMVNFHGEAGFGRYYAKQTYNDLPTPKMNPYNPSKQIKKSNITRYKAHLVGGKQRKTRKVKRTFKRKGVRRRV